jgi:hypothetical protein
VNMTELSGSIKFWEFFSVAEQLLAFQEGLGSMVITCVQGGDYDISFILIPHKTITK